ncbi:hypothetical protein RB614_10530 [Phytohabitans sp. ZYX-F-186]|uniref:Uncharacterized protein n=1 Tax=Phytohabitans maris TaxID=3071409 RepID=A0ABU0ZG78_9ACTN|nr:hypothetical protein [Phytohabitans sp. ZYX-F-186]MDQ7904957.1 hypothetical protein [Phytohabitans sp. ZYX-F-186]
MSDQHRTGRTAAPHRAGFSDVRTVIGLLVGFYGVVLVVMGIVAESAEDRAKTGDVNANLWAGLAMLVFGILFVLWAWLRPVIVDPDETEPPPDNPPPVGGAG